MGDQYRRGRLTEEFRKRTKVYAGNVIRLYVKMIRVVSSDPDGLSVFCFPLSAFCFLT